jgi:protein-S-isoprenylcysteine O-methyltransferase Ste14
MTLNNVLRDRLGFLFFAFAAALACAAAWQRPSALAGLYALHNLLLAGFYARRAPARRYDRTGLWLGLAAALLPTAAPVGPAPWYLLLPGLAGYAMILWSLLALGRRFGIAPADRGLTCRGPYRLVRHPMYLGELIFRVALLLGSEHILFDAALAVALTAIQCARILREERWIAGYGCYARLVRWRLVPGVW